MRVFVFGANGMLGHYVVNTLQKEYTVIPVTRDIFDAMKDDVSVFLQNISSKDVVINCIGAIPQNQPNPREYIQLNTLFPLQLEQVMKHKGFQFIHITTDCVFDGKKGGYTESDEHTAKDIYGTTKSLGEPKDACVIRTSIIGEELTRKKSLLEWVRSNKGGTISGYTNHLWNGVTCLTLSEIILEIIQKNLYWKGLRHIHSPDSITKYELCKYINDVYDLRITILPKDDIQGKNMTLLSQYLIDFKIPTIYEQLIRIIQNGNILGQ